MVSGTHGRCGIPTRRRSTSRAWAWTSPVLLVLLALSACGQQTGVTIDWVDFVHFQGINYIAAPDIPVGRALTTDDLGPIFATVRFKVADNVNNANYQPQDGDAAYLAAGTSVYSVKGYATTFRLAAASADRLILFEANRNPHATTGADLLDIGGKVRSIGLNSDADNRTTQLAAVTDPTQVASLVSLILAAPISQHPGSGSGTRYFLVLYLVDGTAVARAY